MYTLSTPIFRAKQPPMTAPSVDDTSPAAVLVLYATLGKTRTVIDAHTLYHGMAGWAVECELNYEYM